MTTLIISAVCALALGTGSMASSSDTVDVYIIDNQKVENFDGSQLTGKNVASYVIARDESAAKRVHIITTEESGKGKKAELKFKSSGQISTTTSGLDANVIIDGKASDSETLMQFSPDSIASITVHQAGSSVSMEFGDNGKKNVIQVTTKNAETGSGSGSVTIVNTGNTLTSRTSETYSADDLVYILNGKQITSDEFKKLSSKNIKSIEMRKDSEATAKYGAKAVMLITTK